MNEMSVRTWQERFRAGDFSSRNRAVQCKAGWYDWFCRDDALAGRLKKISSVVLGITDPFILDNYYVWFKNNCPLEGPLYDDVRFEPLTGERDGKYFLVALDSHHELIKWTLYTERYGYAAWSAVRKSSLRRNGRTVPPATAVPRIPPLGIPRRRSVHGSMKAVSTPQRQTSRRNRSEKPGSGSRPRTHTCALKRKRRFPACHQSAPRASNPSSGSAGGRQRRSPRRTESSGCVSQQAAGKSLCNL